MDAGNFPTYEKIINTTPLPRTRQENGLFLFEISFDPHQTTRSISVSMRLSFGQFGGVSRLEVFDWDSLGLEDASPELATALAALQPSATHRHLGKHLVLDFIDNVPARLKDVQGTVVINAQNHICAILAPLR
jgi:hypothetical protein